MRRSRLIVLPAVVLMLAAVACQEDEGDGGEEAETSSRTPAR